MALSERLQFILELNDAGVIRGFQGIGSTAEKELAKAESGLDKMGSRLTKVGAGAVAFAGVAGAALWSVGRDAGEQNAAISAMNQVLGESSKKVLDWSDNSVRAVGLSKTAAVDAATGFGGLAKIAGETGDGVADFSTEMVKAAADMAAFKNVSPQQALEDLSAGYAGSTEVLRKYNIYLDENSLKQAYARETGETVTGTLTAQQRIIATHSEIVRQGADMWGQWDREAGSAESQSAMLGAQLDNLKAGIGQGMVPVMTTLLGGANKLVGVFNDLDPATQKAVGGFAVGATGAIALAGGVSMAVGQLIKMRDTFTTVTESGRQLTKLGTVVGGVTGAITIGAVAYSQYAARKQVAEEHTRTFTEALRQEAGGVEDAADKATVATLVNGDYVDMLKDAGVTTAEAAAFIRGDYVPAVEEMGIKHWWARNALKDLQGEFKDAQATVAEQQKAEEDLGVATEDTTETIGDQTGAAQEATRVGGDWQDRMGLVRDAVDRLGDSLTEAAEAQRDQNQAQLDAIGASLDYEDAVDRANDVLEEQRSLNADLAPTVKKYGEESAQTAEAQGLLADKTRDAARAVLDQAEAAATAQGAQEGSNEAIVIQREELQKVADTLDPGNPLRTRLEGYIEQLRTVPERVRTQLEIDQITRRASAVATDSSLEGAPNAEVVATRASGGDLPPGRVLVHAGESLESTPSGVRVRPAGDNRRGGTAGGSTINITLNGASVTADDVSRAVIRAMRTKGRAA